MESNFEANPHNRVNHQQFQTIIKDKANPLGPLGIVEHLAMKLALIQQTPKPFINQPSIFLFAGDHGITAEGLCDVPQVVSRQQILNYARGGATVCAFSRLNRLMLRIVDAGLIKPVDHPQVLGRRIACGTKNFKFEPAMTQDQLEKALRLGIDLVKARTKVGTNTIGFGTCGIGSDIAADLIMIKLLNPHSWEESTWVRGLGKKKQLLYRELLQRYEDLQQPMDILKTFGGFEFAMMLGAMMQCRMSKAAILVDGYVGTLISLLACRIDPALKDYLFICQKSPQPGQQLALEELGLNPILSLGMGLDDGSGVALSYPMFRAAVTFLNEVSTYDEAQVSRPYFN